MHNVICSWSIKFLTAQEASNTVSALCNFVEQNDTENARYSIYSQWIHALPSSISKSNNNNWNYSYDR